MNLIRSHFQTGMHVTMLRLCFAYAIFTAPRVFAHMFYKRLGMTPFKVIFSEVFEIQFHTEKELDKIEYVTHIFFSQWYSTPGTVGCTQSTSSATLSLQANSEKFTKCSLKMFFMDLQIFGENVGSREHLRQKLLQLNCRYTRKDSHHGHFF